MKYAIVTGATRGMGKAIAEKFLSVGIAVAICARDSKTIEEVILEWSEKFPMAKVIGMRADLSIQADAAAFSKFVFNSFPAIDILVNNTGTYLPGNIADEPAGRLEMLLGVNLYSAYYLTRSILPIMKDAQSGHIFNICSIASLAAYPNGGSYGISKYALLGFSENLRLELRPYNIKVTSICPGATMTSSWDGSGVVPERIMEVSDIANTIWGAYTLSPQANVDTIVLRPLKGDI